MSFKVKLWGIRGSLPAPKTPDEVKSRVADSIKDFLAQGYSKESDINQYLTSTPVHQLQGYGGHTTCVEVKDSHSSVVIDAGSGIRKKGIELMSGPFAHGRGEADIIFTHFHWDHIMVQPFFAPLFIPGNKIHMYAVQEDLEEIIKTLFTKPFFPVAFKDLGAEIHFHKLAPREPQEINGFSVTPYLLDHPDPCWGLKFEKENLTYSHCVDTECTRVTNSQLGQDLPLYQDIDLMMFDAQYTIKEASEKVNWGHAAASFGIDLAMRENIRKILFVHHDPASSDEKIFEIESEMRRYHEKVISQMQQNGINFHHTEWDFAVEDLEIEVGA